MKKLFLSCAGMLALALSASAQGTPPGYDPNCPAGQPGPGYGMPSGGQMGVGHPGVIKGGFGFGGGFLSGLFTNHGGGGKSRYHDRVNNAQMLPVANSGTLVFPQNPFIRSPRDYFMLDGGR